MFPSNFESIIFCVEPCRCRGTCALCFPPSGKPDCCKDKMSCPFTSKWALIRQKCRNCFSRKVEELCPKVDICNFEIKDLLDALGIPDWDIPEVYILARPLGTRSYDPTKDDYKPKKQCVTTTGIYINLYSFKSYISIESNDF